MNALNDGIKWKVTWISELIPVIQGLKSMPDDEKKKRIAELEREKKVVEGKSRHEAWKVVKANLEKAIELAVGIEQRATTGEEIVSWRDLIRERRALLDGLEKEGQPPPGG